MSGLYDVFYMYYVMCLLMWCVWLCDVFGCVIYFIIWFVLLFGVFDSVLYLIIYVVFDNVVCYLWCFDS